MIIDSWITPLNDAVAAQWKSVPQYMAALDRFNSHAMLDIRFEDMLPDFEKYGVEKACLSAVWNNYVHIPNDWVAEVVAQYPDKLFGCAAVNAEHGMKAVFELERAVKELGLKGLRLLPYAHKRRPTDNIFYPLYAKCIELDIPVIIQIGHTAPLFPSEVGRPVYLDEVALHFPELKIIGAHIGWPWTEEMIAVAWKHPNVYIDSSAHLPKYYPKEFVHFINTFGQDKVLFASSSPVHGSWPTVLGQIESLGLNETAKQKFLRDNAKRVWKV